MKFEVRGGIGMECIKCKGKMINAKIVGDIWSRFISDKQKERCI